MSKQSREQRRLAEQAAMAQDLSDITVRQFLVAGIEIQPVGIRTQFGPTQGVAVIFHMKDGTTHPPAIIDVIGAMQLMAGVSGVFAGPQGPAAPEPLAVATDNTTSPEPDSTIPEQHTPIGLILP